VFLRQRGRSKKKPDAPPRYRKDTMCLGKVSFKQVCRDKLGLTEIGFLKFRKFERGIAEIGFEGLSFFV
jgi:hypothetical protein